MALKNIRIEVVLENGVGFNKPTNASTKEIAYMQAQRIVSEGTFKDSSVGRTFYPARRIKEVFVYEEEE